jgi:hypothetical protein
MFEFACSDYHVTERLIDESVRSIPCECGKDAIRIVSSPTVKLEGITGAFPGAYDRWERVRAEKLKQEKKAAE